MSYTVSKATLVVVEHRDDAMHMYAYTTRLDMVTASLGNGGLGGPASHWGSDEHVAALRAVAAECQRLLDAIEHPPKRHCNLHDDCDAADEKETKARGAKAAHCWDEDCEECFPK